MHKTGNQRLKILVAHGTGGFKEHKWKGEVHIEIEEDGGVEVHTQGDIKLYLTAAAFGSASRGKEQ